MATIFVNSNAVGANNGTSWTDAYTSIASATGANAGDVLKVEYRHSQSGLTAALNFASGTLIAPVQIVSVDKDNSDSLRTGAVVGFGTTTNIGFTGNLYLYGLTVNMTAANARQLPAASGIQIWENCTGTCSSTGGWQFGDGTNARITVRLINFSIDFSGASAATVVFQFTGVSGGDFEWIGGTYTCRSSQTNLFNNTGVTRLRVEGVTFSGTVTNLFTGAAALSVGDTKYLRCVPPTFTSVYGTAPTSLAGRVELDGFVSGTLTAALLPPTQVFDLRGTVIANTARYRSGGSDDGSQSNPYSWEMASNANASDFISPLVSPPITRWVGTGSQALKVYVASGVTLQDDEFWIEVISPSEAGSPTAKATYRTTRPAPLTAPANLTTDGTSTWSGSGVGTKQYATVTIAPTVAGPVAIRVYLAKPSTTVYVDPVIDVAGDVAGKSRFFQGVQTFAATGGGGSGGGSILRSSIIQGVR